MLREEGERKKTEHLTYSSESAYVVRVAGFMLESSSENDLVRRKRVLPNVLVTGTPGTGKSVTSGR